jgi:hypothetical protein
MEGVWSSAPTDTVTNRVLTTLPIVSEVQLHLVDVTPAPVFARFERTHDGVVGLVEVFRSVLVLGRIATTYVAATEAQPQMDPRIAHLEAFLAAVGVRGDFAYLVGVSASRHGVAPDGVVPDGSGSRI